MVRLSNTLILADRVQLQQVFMNLMLNAIEAMKDEGGKLTIWARPNPEDQLVISIRDTGVGLPAENSERIFAQNLIFVLNAQCLEKAFNLNS